MKFGGMLTPEEAEQEWGIPRSGELVITPAYGLKSKTSIESKKTPSSDGSKMPENSVQSEESSSAINEKQTQDKDTPQDDDPNRPETEEDWKRAGAIRHLKVRHQAKGRQDQTPQ